MGDEFGGRSCPDCGERLSFDARRCVCGWGEKGRKKSEGGARFAPCCRWNLNGMSCRYPVGRAETDYCIFHRRFISGVEAEEYMRDSQSFTPEGYNEAVESFLYGPSPAVEKIRAQTAGKQGKRPSSFGDLSAFIEMCKQRAGGA